MSRPRAALKVSLSVATEEGSVVVDNQMTTLDQLGLAYLVQTCRVPRQSQEWFVLDVTLESDIVEFVNAELIDRNSLRQS